MITVIYSVETHYHNAIGEPCYWICQAAERNFKDAKEEYNRIRLAMEHGDYDPQHRGVRLIQLVEVKSSISTLLAEGKPL